MRWKGTNIKVKAKVLEEKINDISMSSRDIAKKLKEEGLEVSNDTVCDIINNELPQVATQAKNVITLIEVNDNLQSQADTLLAKILSSGEEIKVSDLVSVRESAFKQNQLLTWGKTENIGVSVLSPEEQDNLLKILGK